MLVRRRRCHMLYSYAARLLKTDPSVVDAIDTHCVTVESPDRFRD